jgi:SSS family solute:Na+ symporter
LICGATSVRSRRTTSARNVRVAKWFTALWGLFAIGFALFVSFAENLIEASISSASIFYGVVLGVCSRGLLPPKRRRLRRLLGAIAAQTPRLLALYFTLGISYLWYNLRNRIISAILLNLSPDRICG